MIKRILIYFLCLFLPISVIYSVNAASSVQPVELSKCRRIYAYSGNAAAYFYGFSSDTLVSARVLPDVEVCRAQADGVIRAACHDESRDFALYQSGYHQYGVLTIDMRDGSRNAKPLPINKEVTDTSLAVSGDEIFVICPGKAYSEVFGFIGSKTICYKISGGAERLFTNGDKAYAQSYYGAVYQIGGGQTSFCVQLSAHEKHVNSGTGYILTSSGELVSLSGNRESCKYKAAVKTKSGVFCTNESVTAAGINDRAAVLYSDFRCGFFPIGTGAKENPGSDEKSPEAPSGCADRIAPGMTVAQLKKAYPDVSAVLDAEGNEITSGSIRTGYQAQLHGERVVLAVTGDLNGTGTVNRSDISDLMQSFSSDKPLIGCYSRAADINKDGVCDTRDLVLLAQSAAYDKQ